MIGDVIAREKQLKAGRAKKIALIENMNPEWLDLFEETKEMFSRCEEE